MKFSFRILICIAAFGIAVTSSATAAEIIDPLQTELKNLAPPVESYENTDPTPLEWEQADHPERTQWTKYAYSVINENFEQLSEAKDVQDFCPRYSKLTRAQKIKAWAQIFVGISYWESVWHPWERTFEDMGTDPVTHLPVYSEGLLQLSYQDELQWGSFCHFNWDSDQKLAKRDLHRTIFNPYNNLYCGIRVMAKIVHDNKRISSPLPGYWSTLQPVGTPHTKIKKIQISERKALPFCGAVSLEEKNFLGRFLREIRHGFKKDKTVGDSEANEEDDDDDAP